MSLSVIFKYLFFLNILNSVLGIEFGELKKDYYVVGVVEYPSLPINYTAVDIRRRLIQIRRHIEYADLTADIVVFPESVLNNHSAPVIVPHPTESVILCSNTEYDFIITEISCYARSLNIYLLINIVEVENCNKNSDTSNCPIYNTNVVFDRRGAVISRYRKYNLIGLEWQYFNYTQQPELEATFQTDFNVTFGHFTRMDLLYYRPAQALIVRGISNFLHPSKWQSELPFMTAMQLHQSWAYSNNVNLVVAGTNDPVNGRTGTGIYAGKYGAVIASMTTNATRSMLHLSLLPKKGYNQLNNATKQAAAAHLNYNSQSIYPQKEQTRQGQHRALKPQTQFSDRVTGIKLQRDNDIDFYTTVPITDANGGEWQQQLCHDDLCCHFHIKRSAILNTSSPEANTGTNGSYSYRLAAFQGFGTFLNSETDAVAVCALLACIGDHLYMCARIFPESITVENRFSFDFIQISSNFSRKSKKLILPTNLDGMLQPLPTEAFDMQIHEMSNATFVNYTLLEPMSDLLTFGIYVNYFLDETVYDHHHKNSTHKLNLNIMHLFLYFFIFLLYI